MLTESEFQLQCDKALKDLYQAISRAADQLGFDAEFNGGKLTVEFEDPPAKFVVSPNSPVRQIWVSALVKSFKLDWSPEREAFVLGEQSLKELLGSAIGQQLGEPVSL